MTEAEVVAMLRKACATGGRVPGWGGQTAWAKRNGLPVSNISDVLRGARPPSDAMLRALGLRRVVSYEPKSSAGRPVSLLSPNSGPAVVLDPAGPLFNGETS